MKAKCGTNQNHHRARSARSISLVRFTLRGRWPSEGCTAVGTAPKALTNNCHRISGLLDRKVGKTPTWGNTAWRACTPSFRSSLRRTPLATRSACRFSMKVRLQKDAQSADDGNFSLKACLTVKEGWVVLRVAACVQSVPVFSEQARGKEKCGILCGLSACTSMKIPHVRRGAHMWNLLEAASPDFYILGLPPSLLH